MDKEREIILKYTTKEERADMRKQIKLIAYVIGVALILAALSQYIVWLFYNFEWLNGIWDVVPPSEDTPAIITLVGVMAIIPIMLKWFNWMEPNKDERSIMKERYGVEYDTGEMGGSVEDDE